MQKYESKNDLKFKFNFIIYDNNDYCGHRTIIVLNTLYLKPFVSYLNSSCNDYPIK